MTDKRNSTNPIYSGERLLRWREVQEIVGICRSHAHALAAKGQFPKPIKLGAGARTRASAWRLSEINTWIEQRISEANTEDQS